MTPSIHRILLCVVAVLSGCNGRIGDSSGDPRSSGEVPLVTNQPPHAYAAFVPAVIAPGPARMNGARSSDADGSVVAYRWYQGQGPGAAVIDNASAVSPLVSNLVAGTYRFFLEVTDNQGAKNTDYTDLLVLQGSAPPANTAPTANAGADRTLTGASVTLTGSGADADGTIAAYAWTKKIGGAATIAAAASATTSIVGLAPGVYVFTLTVTDNRGAGGSDDVQVTVNATPPATTTRACGAANEWAGYPVMGTLSLACPPGQVIQSVSFASYGTPGGACGGYTVDPTCHAVSTLQQLQASCVGRASCTATNFNALFGDPCPGTSKRISAQVECGSAPAIDAGVPVIDAGAPVIDAGTPNPNPVTALTFSAIPTSDPDFIGPGRGLEIWNGINQAIDYPTDGAGPQSLDHYFRFTWAQLEGARDAYNWTRFDSEMKSAIDSGKKFAFGVMTACPGCDPGFNGMLSYAGADSAYPPYLHADMQAESVKDWISSNAGSWIPNWNSAAYLTRFEKLLGAINTHLETTSHNGVPFKNAVNYIDIRGYGAWGEWHNGGIVDNLGDANQQPQAARATAVTLNRLIDAHVVAFPNHQLVAMISTFDANRLQNTLNPASVGLHALQSQNARGYIGWRRDNWGCLDNRCGDYLRYYSDLHPNLTMRALIMDRYKLAPINGEPMNGGSVVGDASGATCYYFELKTQVERYHASSFGNGNFQGVTSAQCARDNVRAAARASGYRLVLTGGSLTSNVGSGRQLSVRLDWRNIGLTPTYEDWAVTFELRNASGATVWSGASSFALRLFLPAASASPVTDAFVLPGSVAPGAYSLRLVVKDPKAFRKPLPLGILGRATDGSYPVGMVTVP